jgi:hypothetical protein
VTSGEKNKQQTNERKRPYMTSTTEIASNVVEELDKNNLSCDKKGRRTVRKQDRTLPNHLTPNGHFSGRTAPLTYRCCIFFIYSTDIRTKYFKRAA